MKIVIIEKEMTTSVRIPLEYSISIEKFRKSFPDGSFRRPETPCEYVFRIPGCEGVNFTLTENAVRAIVRPSKWDRVKGDAKRFLEDMQWEKFKKEDLQIDHFKNDVKKAKRWLLK